jgi:hypothetical protein
MSTEEFHRHRRIYQTICPAGRARLLNRLDAMLPAPKHVWYRTPLVRLTNVLMIAATLSALMLIQHDGVPQTILMLWGTYVIALDTLILYRTAKKLVLRRI